ncbi:hypothetical protein CK222_21795 [Mesorhizobium sp. WSM3866]|nr:hypothetical protein CK222_21795 [Mesorhizobium sp. WSM3866]
MSPIGIGIVFKLEGDGTPAILRYVHGERHTFPAHVAPGENLLITDENVLVTTGDRKVPDSGIAMRVLAHKLAQPLRTILW